MRRPLTTSGLGAVAALAVALAPSAAAANTPYGSPVPVPSGVPFPLAGGLAANVRAIDADRQRELALPRVVEGAPRQLVLQRVNALDGTAAGAAVVVSDADTPPADGLGEPAVAVAWQPEVPRSLPAVPAPVPGQPAPSPPPPPPPPPVDQQGAWLVVWAASAGAGDVRVVGRRIGADGTPLGAPVTLSETTYEEVGELAVTVASPERTALVAWRAARAEDGGRAHVAVQGWDAAAGRVAPYAARVSSLAGDAAGSLGLTFDGGSRRQLVVWRGTDPAAVGDTFEQEVLGRVLGSTGTAVGDVVRISRVGADGDLFARPVDAAVEPAGVAMRASGWAVAWSQAPAGDAAVRLLDAQGQGAAERVAAAAPAGEQIEGVAIGGFSTGRAGLAYDVGAPLRARRVELQPLLADGAPSGVPIPLSDAAQDARTPLFAGVPTFCQTLVAFRGGTAGAAYGRLVWEPDCVVPCACADATPTPTPRPPQTVPERRRVRPVWGTLRLSDVRFGPRRLRVGRTAILRARVTAPATVVVSIARGPRGRGASSGRRLPRLRPTAATLRRVLVRRPQRVVVRVQARDGRGRALQPGRYKLVVRATPPAPGRAVTRRLPFRVVGR